MAITVKDIEAIRTAIRFACDSAGFTPRQNVEANRVVEKMQRDLQSRLARKEAHEAAREENEDFDDRWNGRKVRTIVSDHSMA